MILDYHLSKKTKGIQVTSQRLNTTIHQLFCLLLIGAFAMVLPLHWSAGHDGKKHASGPVKKTCSGSEHVHHVNLKTGQPAPLQNSPLNKSSKHDHRNCVLCHVLAGMFTPPVAPIEDIACERFIATLRPENRKLIFDAGLFDFPPRPPPIF